ncbi:MAG: helix-turn-helix domain-containing protein [Candidatus Coproplasma sp.]
MQKKRLEKNLTQEQVAEQLNLNIKTYRNYEQGLREPKIELLKKFATFFGCTIDELL